jgi:uncharacterized protein YjiS (DUF1127 family)
MYRYNSLRSIAPGAYLRALLARCRPLFLRLSEGLFRMMERARERRKLAALDDRLLKDIGLTRSDVEAEISRPFWR